MTSEVIGMTNEGRNIKVIKINSNNTRLPVIFIDAGIHAREWISPASTLFLIEKLARQISKGRGRNDIAKFQWHIIPLANPDGYEYTRCGWILLFECGKVLILEATTDYGERTLCLFPEPTASGWISTETSPRVMGSEPPRIPAVRCIKVTVTQYSELITHPNCRLSPLL